MIQSNAFSFARVALFAGVIGAAIPAALAASGPVVLVPHRAVYEFTLATSRGASGVSEANGRMVYELTGSACEGYTQNMRFVTRMASGESGPSLTDLRSSSWEDGEAKKFRFSSSQFRDDKQTEATAGDAARDAARGAAKIDLTRPAKKAVDLAAGVYFPIQHSIALIDAAREGKTSFKADLFDGSEKGDKIYDTSATIGRAAKSGVNAALPAAKNADKLNGITAWPVTISYYEKGSEAKDALPVYELGFLFFENGVSRKLLIDYGEFAIKGELTEITFLDAGACTPKK